MAWKLLISLIITAGLVPVTVESSTPGRGIYEKIFQGTEFELKNSGRICPADMVDRMEKGLDDKYFRDFFRKHGVKIITELNRLRTTGCCCMAIRLSSVKKSDYNDILRYLDRALDRYPPGFVKQYVQKIVVAGKITAKGHPIGGYTKVGSGIVFLSTGRSGISSLGPVFHHEFNHVLYGYANQAHAAEAFAMATEKGFRYGRGGIDYILSGNGGCSPSDDWFAKGFACNYGTAAVEEDYATLAGYALSDWEDFSKRALKHEKIARKFMGLIQFYNSFDSRMDEFFWTGKADYGSDGPYAK